MPKKPIVNRLDNLFAQLAPAPGDDFLPNWTWEWDAQEHYTSCSPQVSDCLGFQAHRFIGQSIYGFALVESSANALRALLQQNQPTAELDVYFLSSEGSQVPVHLNITRQVNENGELTGWFGEAKVTPAGLQVDTQPIYVPAPPPTKAPVHPTPPVLKEKSSRSSASKATPHRTLPQTSPLVQNVPAPSSALKGIAFSGNELMPATQPWTPTGRNSLQESKPYANVEEGIQSVFAIPFQLRDQAAGVLEMVDETSSREWSEDDRLLAQEVVSQLTLALENARLYATVQQELSERIRAEEEITRRNKDLAALNQIGQRLSKLATPDEIFSLVNTVAGQALNNHNLSIAIFDRATNQVSFPICQVDGRVSDHPEDVVGTGITDLLQRTKAPVLLNSKLEEFLKHSKVQIPMPAPKSLLAVPMLAGERILGGIILQDYEHENVFTQVQVELLSTVASQASTALENANLFQEIRTAFQAIENRERYQANVARAVANLTEQGSKSIANVLELLGQAANTDRVYFAQARDSDEGAYWRVTSTWVRPEIAAIYNKSIRTQEIPVGRATEWANHLREKGFITGLPGALSSTESRLLLTSPKSSVLALAVPGKGSTPNFIAFEQFEAERQWLNEEINVLQVAADALSNTFIREDLLVQIQSSLDETENLYNTSHQLALANDFDEMVISIADGLRIPDINRAFLLLSDYDPQGIFISNKVVSNWYSGKGTPPPVQGADFSDPIFDGLFYQQNSTFINDVNLADLDPAAHEQIDEQNVRALASLPLRTAKQQIGTLVLLGDIPHIFNGRETRSLNSLADQMTTSVENRQLFDQTQAALSETGLLYKVSAGISEAHSSQDLIQLVADNVLPQNSDRASLFIVNSSSSGVPLDVEIAGFYDKTGQNQIPSLRLQASSLPYINQLTSEPLVLTDVASSTLDSVSKKTLAQFKVRSGIIIPLRSADRLVGMILTASDKPSDFTPEEVRLLQVTGASVAVAVERQRLLQDTQRRALELQTAAEIARDTTSTLAMDVLLGNITKLVIERFNFYHVSIYLLDESKNFAVISESAGEAAAELKEKGYRLAVGSRSIIGSVTADGKPIIVNDVATHALYYPHPLLPDTHAEMTLPLKAGDRIIGVLDIQSRQANAFGESDLAVFQVLSDQIAVGIENARSYELAQKAYEEIREVDRLKNQFLANMSHELRTPLNSIIGFSRVILKGIDGPINDTQKQDLTAIYNSGQHLLGLINNVLDLSKIEAGKMELQYSDVNINDIVVTTMSTASGLTKDKNIKLYQVISPEIPIIRADATRVRQVLLNFISNAAKFTDEGSITIEAKIITSPTNTPEVMLSVTDTGPGIAEKDRYKLFQPFSQVDDSPTRKTGGTGLGLSICKSFIEMHKGRIGLLSSEVGKGSTFFFTLPLPIPEPVVPEEPEAPPEKIILSIEDDPQVISLYERYLKPQGYTVIALTESKKAVETAIRLKPFAITLDVMMPEKDGWTVMSELKTNPATRDIPVIFCSILEEEEKGFSLGAADYLVKPFLQEDLINTVARLNYNGQIKTILIVDDDEDDLRLVQKVLEESKQFQTILARTGNDGLELMASAKPDAVILDLFLSDTNGFTVLEKMRSDSELKDMPVIILTGADLTPEQHQQLANFGQLLLNKASFRESELLGSLDAALRQIKPAS